MQLQKIIDALIRLRQEYGPDLQVVQNTSVGIRNAGLPRVRHLNKRHPKRRFFVPGSDLDQDKGDPVVLLD